MVDPDKLAHDIDAVDYSALTVLDHYLDRNGHLNTGYYAVLMDRAVTLVFQHLGLGRATTWPRQMRDTLQALLAVHRRRPVPLDAGKPVAIRRKEPQA